MPAALKLFQDKNKKFTNFLIVSTNPCRDKILKFLFDNPKDIPMRELYEKLGGKKLISYKCFFVNIKVLQTAKLIKIKQNLRSSGQALTIKNDFLDMVVPELFATT